MADLAHPELDPADLHHLATVLRLRDGESVILADGAGRWRPAHWRRDATVDVAGDIEIDAPRSARVGVAFAPLKGDRSDLVVQKLTELGVDVLQPVRTRRSVVRWDESRARRAEQRWERIVREAWCQSRGSWLPRVEAMCAWEDLVTRAGVVVAEPGAPALTDRQVDTDRDEPVSLVVIGPEGGLEEAELAVAPHLVSLPGGILRAETAAIVAATLLVVARDRTEAR